MNDWIRNLVGFWLIASIALQMLPNQKYEQYLRLFIGFFLIILLFHPLWKIGSLESYLKESVDTFVDEQEKMEAAIEKKSLRLGEDTVEEVEITEIEKIRVEVGKDDEEAFEGADMDGNSGGGAAGDHFLSPAGREAEGGDRGDGQ